jgi:signal transduction histidine kinase/CheY-like chemotaxis protein
MTFRYPRNGSAETRGVAMKLHQAVFANAVLLVVYFAAGRFGLANFATVHPSAAAVWLPTGIALAALLLGGLRLTPAVLAGAFLVNVTTSGSVATSLGVAVGNALEAVLGATLVARFAGGCDAFSSATGLLKFTGLAALLGTTASASIGVVSLLLGGQAAESDALAIWFTWWLGDAAGAVLMTPLIVLWWTNRGWVDWTPHKAAEAALLLAAIGFVGGITFFHPALGSYPLAFLCLGPLVAAALRFGPREIATAVVMLAAVATAATAAGRGPFAVGTPNESLLVLQAFLVAISMTALPMAALTVERRALLERERAARALADAASRAKDEFLAILSHELRNPLAAISTAAAVLDTGAGAGGDAPRLVASIRRQSQHLARLIDDLLDIGRMTANKLILRKEPVELADAVRRCVDVFATTRGLPSGRIELALAPVWIDADPVRVAQIVENLIGNALKHTPVGRPIRASVRDLGEVAELRVEDEGLGIRSELLPHVFDAFTQGQQGLDRSAGGLGLGLTLVRRLTELHHGTIEARSGGANRGSAFIVRFPSRAPPTGAPVAAATEARSGEQPCRLLIVEDNVDARQTLRALLEALGHEVHEAGDGEAGAAAALELRPDLVLIDIGLPRVDGYEVARRLRAANLPVRLVALTGYGRDVDLQRAKDAGFDSHLLKPASLEQLTAAIDAVRAS